VLERPCRALEVPLLHYCCGSQGVRSEKARVAVARALITRWGADIWGLAGTKKMTSQTAAKFHHPALVDFFITECKMPVKTKEEYSGTPLMNACRKNSSNALRTVKLLVEKLDADPTLPLSRLDLWLSTASDDARRRQIIHLNQRYMGVLCAGSSQSHLHSLACWRKKIGCRFRFLRPLSFLVRWFRIRWAARRRRNSHEARQVEIETVIQRMPADAAIGPRDNHPLVAPFSRDDVVETRRPPLYMARADAPLQQEAVDGDGDVGTGWPPRTPSMCGFIRCRRTCASW